jgi:response regulator RpfG family c-di-GMP phosphodiesterase
LGRTHRKVRGDVTRILMVDDEPRILDGLRRNLASHFNLEVALSGDDGLKVLTSNRGSTDPFGVVVSDMMMPTMNGAEFLAKAHEIAPDAVLMILSGQADLRSTVAAVNNSKLFRFIAKPCSPHALRTAIDDALRQYQLLNAERDLLQQTLAGAVDVLAQVLSLANPDAFSRTNVMSALIDAAAKDLQLDQNWELRMAGKLSQIGLVAIPPDVLEHVESGATLTDQEESMYAGHPKVAHDLLARIPRMERVAEWIAQQNNDGHARPDPTETELCIDILAVGTKFMAAREAGETPTATARRLGGSTKHQPDVIRAMLTAASKLNAGGEIREVRVNELHIGMVFLHDVLAANGVTLVRKNDKVTEAVKVRLNNFTNSVGVTEPMRVLVPH